MKLVWCPDMASKAFFDAVELLSTNTPDEEGSGGGEGETETGLAELLAAMAGGWNSQCIVEILPIDKPSTSTATVALSAAAVRTGGRHIRTFQSEEVTIEGMDFAVVDFERRDAVRVLREARVGPRGAVLVSKNGRRCGGDLTSNSAGFYPPPLPSSTQFVSTSLLLRISYQRTETVIID